MSANRIQLQNHDGSPCRWIGERELSDLQAASAVTRVSGRRDAIRVYRYRQPVEASTSAPSSACATPADMRAMAGIERVDETRIERLIGLRLLPEGMQVPRGGYLRKVIQMPVRDYKMAAAGDGDGDEVA